MDQSDEKQKKATEQQGKSKNKHQLLEQEILDSFAKPIRVRGQSTKIVKMPTVQHLVSKTKSVSALELTKKAPAFLQISPDEAFLTSRHT
jgi:hypothetical protein